MAIPKRLVVFRHRLGSAPGAPEEFWIEAEVDAEWTVAYRIHQHAGYPVIAELRLFPSERPAEQGEPHAHPRNARHPRNVEYACRQCARRRRDGPTPPRRATRIRLRAGTQSRQPIRAGDPTRPPPIAAPRISAPQ